MNNHFSSNRVVVFLLMILLLLVAGCEQDIKVETPVAEARSFTGTIVAVGDSLTAGLGVDEQFSYPSQLQERLDNDGYNYRVINAGVSGETTSGTVSRLDWIMTMKPDIVILEIGANDGLRGIDVKVPEENLIKILNYFKRNKVITVFTGMQMVWNLGPEYTAEFNAIYPAIAKDHGVIFMPFFLKDVATVRALNIEDGLHPNGDGYTIIVDNLYPYVKEAIGRFTNHYSDADSIEEVR